MYYTSFDNIGLVKVLKLLKSHQDEYLSGQDLSQVLKISRVAVWKHINKIRSLGYKIHSKQNRGYKLTKTTEIPLPWEIIDNLETKIFGKRVYYFDSIGSTQDFALGISPKPNENGTVVISQKQTAGKGRLGRKWISPKGGIWFSIILHPKFDVSLATLFPIASSLALAIAIEKTLKLKPELKWPNDLTLNGKKVAGMLVDVSVESNKIGALILGVGINFKIDDAKVKNALKRTSNFYGVASLLKQNDPTNPAILICKFLLELEKIFHLLTQSKTKTIIQEWTKRSSTIGKNVTISTSNGKISGTAKKIDSDGALIVTKNKTSQRILVGDVMYVKK